MEVKDNITVEYGSELKIEDLTDQKDLKIKDIKDFDSKKTGEQKVNVIFTDSEKEATKEITLTVKEKPKENNTTSASSGYTNNATVSNQKPVSQAPAQSGGNTQSSPQPSKTVCPRTGLEPEDPSQPCDAVLGWGEGDGFYNSHIKFDSPQAAYQWGWEQMHNPEYDEYAGYGSSSLCTNDGYCDWGEVYFYK